MFTTLIRIHFCQGWPGSVSIFVRVGPDPYPFLSGWARIRIHFCQGGPGSESKLSAWIKNTDFNLDKKIHSFFFLSACFLNNTRNMK